MEENEVDFVLFNCPLGVPNPTAGTNNAFIQSWVGAGAAERGQRAEQSEW